MVGHLQHPWQIDIDWPAHALCISRSRGFQSCDVCQECATRKRITQAILAQWRHGSKEPPARASDWETYTLEVVWLCGECMRKEGFQW